MFSSNKRWVGTLALLWILILGVCGFDLSQFGYEHHAETDHGMLDSTCASAPLLKSSVERPGSFSHLIPSAMSAVGPYALGVFALSQILFSVILFHTFTLMILQIPPVRLYQRYAVYRI